MSYEEILENAKEFDEIIPTIHDKKLKNLANLISEEEEIKDLHVSPVEHKDVGKCLLAGLNERIGFVKADSHLSIPYENIDAVGLVKCKIGVDLLISTRDDDQIPIFK